MTSKYIFYFTPQLLPASNAAAIRNSWLIKAIEQDGNKVYTKTNSNLFFKLPTNKENNYKRLIKEFLAGVSLSFSIITSRPKDLYIFSSPPYFTVLIAVLTCMLLRRKYALDIRDIYPQVFFQLKLISKSSMVGKLLLFLSKVSYKNAIFITTVTFGLKKIINEMAPFTPIEIIYNGYDPINFKPSNKKFNNFTVVFHGTLAKFQRTDLIAKVAESLYQSHPDIDFKVIGEGPGEKFLENTSANLEYLGKMEYSEIGNYISRCHLGLSLRTDDNISIDAFPVKVFEYIGVKIPIIISPKGEASDFIEQNKLGSYTENNVNSIREKILNYFKYNTEITFDSNLFTRQSQSKKIINLLKDSTD